MPLVNIKLAGSRSTEQKRELAEALTGDIVRILDVPAEAVTITVEEYALDNIAKAGKLFLDLRKPSK